jgi:hypothetical protein
MLDRTRERDWEFSQKHTLGSKVHLTLGMPRSQMRREQPDA